MAIVELVGAILQLIIIRLETSLELNKERKQKRKEAIVLLEEAITKRDADKLTAAFDSYNRVR